MKRVAILKSRFGQNGGLEKYTAYTAEAFAKQGYEVTVLTTLQRRHKSPFLLPPHMPFRLVTLGASSWLGAKDRLDFDLQCRRWLRRNKQDIVFGMDRNTCQTHYRVGEGVHKAYLNKRSRTEPLHRRFSFPINPLHRVNLYLERKTFRDPKVRAIFTNSHMVRAEVARHYQVDRSRLHVVHNGVEWSELQGTFDSWQSMDRTEIGLDPSRYQFLFVGHGYRRKGLAYLLKGLALLPRDAWELSVIGRDRNEAHYEALVRRLGLQKNVHFFGAQSQVHHFMQAADAIVIPSLYDPFANVTLEALALGCYVVSSPYNGGKEILTPQTGTVINSLFDPDSMAEALSQALEFPKTPDQALITRNSVQHLDFSSQLNKMIDITLSS